MTLYAGIDLHSNNNYLGIKNHDGKKIFHKKLKNKPEVILSTLKPYKKEIDQIAIESTFNWYWLVDMLIEEKYVVKLANPSAIQQYEGLKHADDKHDAFWLAEMLRLGILPTGYIYPRESRPIRDLLRKRSHLVRLRTSLILSLQNIIARNYSMKLSVQKIKQKTYNNVAEALSGACEDLALSGQVSKVCIDSLSQNINQIELKIKNKLRSDLAYKHLHTVPGIGDILALTITLETGPIERFPKVGNFTSYSRKAPSSWTSNNKKKGKGNTKNGNKYLSWAFSEAVQRAKQYDKPALTYFNKKASRSNYPVAYAALANKLARAAYYIMRDKVPFDHKKLFA
jgi:transposase